MKIIRIDDPKEKGRICEMVLRSLPQWFGIESAIQNYIQDVQKMETWAAVDSEVVGFLSLKKNNPFAAEIYVMGLLPQFHGMKIGAQLVRAAEQSLASQAFKFLSVKTLGESRPDTNYDRTRRFYLRCAFTPIEEFKDLWGENNPCLLLIKSLDCVVPDSNLIS